MRNLSISFSDVIEIRMGSPYNCATIIVSGSWIPDIPKDDWQDISAQSPDGRVIGLIHWDTPNNEPGFKIYTIDTVDKSISISDRVAGCCEHIEWNQEINAFTSEVFSIALKKVRPALKKTGAPERRKRSVVE